ncbi:MAG: SRPBCC domain-containing protein [Steroidobacteraceae bacterium]
MKNRTTVERKSERELVVTRTFDAPARIEVTPCSRLVWTNDEGGDGGPVTTVTFEERGGKTLLVMHELYPSKDAFDAAGTGAADGMGELFGQLDELLVTLGATGVRA